MRLSFGMVIVYEYRDQGRAQRELLQPAYHPDSYPDCLPFAW